jgi:peroxiredoxin
MMIVPIASPKFLEEFFARTVYIVDTKGKIAYKQVIAHIEKEPNYKDILAALKGITLVKRCINEPIQTE